MVLKAREKREEENEPFPWLDLLLPPEKQIDPDEYEDFSRAMSLQAYESKSALARIWKQLFAAIDLWAANRSWTTPCRLDDLEPLLDNLVSVSDISRPREI